MKVDIRTILRQMMAVYNVEVTEIAHPYTQIIKHDYLELREKLAIEVKVDEKILLKYLKSLSMNGVTLIEDVIGISFVLFLLPDTRNCIIVGPYRTKEFSQVIDKLHLTANQAHTLKEMLMLIPEVSEDLIRLTLVPVISTIFEKENYEVHHFLEESPQFFVPDFALFREKETSSDERRAMLEVRYQAENELLEAVAKGDTVKAYESLGKMRGKDVAERFTMSLITQKNSLIIFNTLLRKTIEEVGVHPYTIDEISSRFSNMIEMMMDEEEYMMLMKMLITEYSEYALKYGNSQHHPIVQKMVNLIHAELNTSISLNSIAKSMNMNASYLSNLFKQETGMTLMYFINQQKINLACEYLKKTQQNITQIADKAGFMDVNYFTRVFKKHMGVSPTEYRRHYS
ncbi:MAG: helix-turn-helix transcriptional regulator [Erysipelotrichaceae bacterium]|nr:helix-turn-helix transcriptional regulator [Erysipelotrichaceae bacterium]